LVDYALPLHNAIRHRHRSPSLVGSGSSVVGFIRLHGGTRTVNRELGARPGRWPLVVVKDANGVRMGWLATVAIALVPPAIAGLVQIV
jgi:hypothetical protein